MDLNLFYVFHVSDCDREKVFKSGKADQTSNDSQKDSAVS